VCLFFGIHIQTFCHLILCDSKMCVYYIFGSLSF
jgi:hypothetical protein